MENMKYKARLLAYVLVIAVFFAAGYGAGVINGKNRVKEDIAAAEETPEAVKAAAKAETEETDITEPFYELLLEDGYLTIYEDDTNTKSIVARCVISESVYPAEDVLTLREGLQFTDKTDAMAMFENFAS